jgi:hypothetical protein
MTGQDNFVVVLVFRSGEGSGRPPKFFMLGLGSGVCQYFHFFRQEKNFYFVLPLRNQGSWDDNQVRKTGDGIVRAEVW